MLFLQTKQRLQDLISGLPKTHLLATVFILLAIPITVILSQSQQNLRKEASEKKAVQSASSNPNIVIIMLDDVNPMDGRFFTKERTPNIYKSIISKGINFTNFYVETNLCCPGRAGYLTGQHTQNHGIADLIGTSFNPETTIATELKSVGYYTMLLGKYLNQFRAFPEDKKIPPGWDKFDAIYENNGKYYDYDFIHKNKVIDHYGKTPEAYSTDVISNWAIKRLVTVPLDKPLFLTVNPYAIHGPFTPAPRHSNDPKCQNIRNWNPPDYNESDVSDKSRWIRVLPLLEPTNFFYNITVQCETLLSVDEMVGKIKAELEKQGRLTNTVFIMTADNGFGFGENRMSSKTVPYSTHVPLYISWPDGRGTSPRTEETILSNIDLAPSLCELAGCTMGPYPNGQEIADGISFASLIKDQAKNFYRDAILESQYVKPADATPNNRPPWWALRSTEQNPLGLWHYIEYDTGEKELYDMTNGPCYLWNANKSGDPCELENLLRSDKTPSENSLSVASALKKRLDALKNEKGFVPPPTPSISPSLTPTPTPTIEITPEPSITPTPTPEETTITMQIKADSYVKSDSPSSNFGTSSTLNIKASNPIQSAFFKFPLPNLSGKTITKALLKLRTSTAPFASVEGDNKLEVKSVSNSWNQSNLTYSSKPAGGKSIGSKLGSIAVNSSFEIDITEGLLGKTGGDVSFSLESTGSNENSLQVLSKESSFGNPVLVLTYQ